MIVQHCESCIDARSYRIREGTAGSPGDGRQRTLQAAGLKVEYAIWPHCKSQCIAVATLGVTSPSAALRCGYMSLQVFHVDDNPQDLELTEMAFHEADKDIGYTGIEDPRGSLVALQMAAATTGVPPPHLVLLDISMPGMTGIELLDRIRMDKRLAAVPVVMLSTSNSLTDREASLSRGAARFETKPHSYQQLVTLARALATWVREGAR